MLTRLGKPAAAGDAVDLLLECHVRIRQLLAVARRIAEARGEDPAAVAEAAGRVVRYFTQALPLHARDEEDSILPRLRGRDPAVDRALGDMTREHAEHERPLAALVLACDGIASEPGRHADLAAAVLEPAAALERHFAAHLAREEEVVFPAVRRLLGAAEDAAIVAEIRRRRGVGEPPAPAPPAGSRGRSEEAPSPPRSGGEGRGEGADGPRSPAPPAGSRGRSEEAPSPPRSGGEGRGEGAVGPRDPP